MADRDISGIHGTPPYGMYEPLRGFSLIWASDYEFEELGWATAPERGSCIAIQSFGNVQLIMPIHQGCQGDDAQDPGFDMGLLSLNFEIGEWSRSIED